MAEPHEVLISVGEIISSQVSNIIDHQISVTSMVLSHVYKQVANYLLEGSSRSSNEKP